jgi:hypothetical protein
VVFGTIYATDVFRCVIESMSTKYTMFNPLGVPIRATVNLKLKEADSVMMKPGEAAAPAAAAKK